MKRKVIRMNESCVFRFRGGFVFERINDRGVILDSVCFNLIDKVVLIIIYFNLNI